MRSSGAKCSAASPDLGTGVCGKIQGHHGGGWIRSLGDLLAQRRIPVSVENSGNKSSLTEHACPYPTLAESDRSVCTMEKMLFSELSAPRLN